MRLLFPSIFLAFLFFSAPLLAQDLEPTADEALMKVKVVDTKESPKKGQKVKFIAKGSGKEYTKTTGEDGSFEILLPKGDAYQATYEVFGEKQKYKVFEVPDKRGKMKFNFKIVHQMPRKVTLDDVHFNTGEATLRESSYEALGHLKKALERNPNMRVEIAGHTDSRGDKADNQELSEERAKAVVKYLKEQGVDASRLEAKGYGERKPIAPNDTEKGRQQNRRTEVRILEK